MENVAINLLESNTFTTVVQCSLPGSGADVRRPFEFKATFELIPQSEWEDLVNEETKSACLARVLKSVEGVPGGVIKDDNGNDVTLTPAQVVCRNPLTCDAAFTKFHLYVTEDGRKAIISAADRKNFKRSRRG